MDFAVGNFETSSYGLRMNMLSVGESHLPDEFYERIQPQEDNSINSIGQTDITLFVDNIRVFVARYSRAHSITVQYKGNTIRNIRKCKKSVNTPATSRITTPPSALYKRRPLFYERVNNYSTHFRTIVEVFPITRADNFSRHLGINLFQPVLKITLNEYVFEIKPRSQTSFIVKINGTYVLPIRVLRANTLNILGLPSYRAYRRQNQGTSNSQNQRSGGSHNQRPRDRQNQRPRGRQNQRSGHRQQQRTNRT